MKKAWCICGAALLTLAVAFMASYILMTAPSDGGTFSLETYTDELANPDFQTTDVCEPVTDYRSAAAEGKKAMAAHFSVPEGNLWQWKGCLVEYDPLSDAYHVQWYRISLLPMFGGGHHVILKSDGTVLAIWGSK